MRRRLLYSAVFGLVVLGIAGCGGGDDEDTTTAPVAPVTEAPAALSKEELVVQGNGICAEVNAAVGTVGTTDSTAASEAVQVADLYAGMVERLRGLGRPSDDSAGYDEFIAAAEGLDQAESDVELAAERGEEEALTTAESDASSALASFQSAAGAYGLAECAEGPSAPAPGAGTGGAVPEEPVEGIEEEELAPEVEEEVAPETGGAGSAEEAGGAGGGAPAGGGTEGGGEAGGGESSGGGIGPG
jgi:uncharacterized membrane protein YgcG